MSAGSRLGSLLVVALVGCAGAGGGSERAAEGSGPELDVDAGTYDGGASWTEDDPYDSVESPAAEDDAGQVLPERPDDTPDAPSAGGSSGGGDVMQDAAALCAAVDSCYQARRAGELAGDESGEPVVATGTHSEWVTVRVREDSGLSRGLDVVFELSSQGNTDYDLFVYPDSGECTGESQASAVSGAVPEEVAVSWKDRYLFWDDSRTLSVEVRYVGGDCNPWVLKAYRP